jgi:hypothetical protein
VTLDLSIDICVTESAYRGEVEERVLEALFGKTGVRSAPGFIITISRCGNGVSGASSLNTFSVTIRYIPPLFVIVYPGIPFSATEIMLTCFFTALEPSPLSSAIVIHRAFYPCVLIVSYKVGVHFQPIKKTTFVGCRALLEGLYLFTLYALRY